MVRSPLLPALAAAALAACSPGDGAGFRYGASHSLAVEGQEEVQDPVSGLTFAFPDGGRGTFTLTEILEAPERPAPGGRGWRVEHDGAAEFFVRVPVGEDEDPACWAWGFLEGSTGEGIPRDGRWVPVSGDDLEDGTWAYEWVMPFEAAAPESSGGSLSAALVPRSGHLGSSQYWINSVKAGASDIERQVALGLQVATDIDAWLDALPAAQATAARARVPSLRHKRFYGENYYIGFTRHLLWTTVTPMLGLRLDADAQSIAHEVGHYMTHVLAGDEPYLAIEDTAPDQNHGLGIHQPGRILVEDYAYFSQFFLTGSVRGADPILSRHLLGDAQPGKVDVPCIEGFGTALLGSLYRTAPTTVGQVSRAEEPVPVVAAPLGDILALYAHGAVNADALWPHLATFVADRGQAGALPVLAERAGWSYAARGRVVDSEGRPLEGIEVSNVAVVAGTEYDNGAAGRARTGRDGVFRLRRLFPGGSLIRLDLPAGRKDVAVHADPAAPTTREADLGDLAGASGPDTVAHCAVRFAANFAWNGNPDAFVDSVGVGATWAWPQDGTTSFAGDTWEASWTTYPGAGIRTTGTSRVVLSPSRDRVVSFRAEESDLSGTDVQARQALEGHDLPLAGASDGTWSFRVKGAAACDHVDQAARVSRLDDGTPVVDVTGWTCDDDSEVVVGCR